MLFCWRLPKQMILCSRGSVRLWLRLWRYILSLMEMNFLNILKLLRIICWADSLFTVDVSLKFHCSSWESERCIMSDDIIIGIIQTFRVSVLFLSALFLQIFKCQNELFCYWRLQGFFIMKQMWPHINKRKLQKVNYLHCDSE